MGDLSTHRRIYESTVRPILISQMHLTSEEAQYFELGNWLRDVSQFRDPYSFQLKKLEILAKVRQATNDKRIIDIWIHLLNEAFGPSTTFDAQSPIVTGALGEWFRNILLALGQVVFCVRIPNAQEQGLTWFAPRDAIPEAEFTRLFAKFFTQYYPYEHLDFPPTGDPKVLGDWSTQSTRSQGMGGPRRRLLAYLDEFVEYIAIQFLNSEISLRALLALRRSSPEAARSISWNHALHETLVMLGRASHAFEDYYFHSNFVELAYLLTYPGAEDGDLRAFYRVENVGRLAEGEKRKLFRRTRAPRLVLKNGLSLLDPINSDFAPAIFTGTFGGDDTLYTFADAFEGLNPTGTALFVKLLNSTLFRYLLVGDYRRKLVKRTDKGVINDDNRIAQVTDACVHETLSEELPKKATQIGALLRLGPAFAEAINRANRIDEEFMLEWVQLGPWVSLPYNRFCISNVLLTVASNVEVASQENNRLAAVMNSRPRDEYYIASANSNRAEDVGSHTLLAKDSERKQPLRKITDQFARSAVQIALQALAERVKLPTAQGCIDWSDFLRQLLCHPAQAPGDWVRKKLKNPDVSVNPSIFKPIPMDQTSSKEALSNGLKQTDTLAEAYRKLYEQAAEVWRNTTL